MRQSREIARAELCRAAGHVRAAQSISERPDGCVVMLGELAMARRRARRAVAALASDCLVSALEAVAVDPRAETEAALEVIEQMDVGIGTLCPGCQREVAKAIRRRGADRT